MSSRNLAISVRGLGKAYTIQHTDKHDTLAELAVQRLRNPFRRVRKETFSALRDVSFDVYEGEVVGIIGRNGAGKSTLLKVLSRITEPTAGRIDLYGRTGSLLEVGTGFHRELTGRENIYLNGGILGMSRTEIDGKFDEIVEFAGTERFLDTPVKRYSSGMYVRLAFAVAAHLNPEILIVDEVLAVGDAEFQRKCLGKMSEVSREGRTVLFVSHNMTAVMNLCTRAILLRDGAVVADGKVVSVVNEYFAADQECDVFRPDRGYRAGDGRAFIEGFQVVPSHPQTGGRVDFVFDIFRPEGDAEAIPVDISVDLLTDQDAKVLQVYSPHVGREIEIGMGRTRVTASLDQLPMTPGRYRIDLWLGSGDHGIDHIQNCFLLNVVPGCLVDDVFVDNRGFPVVAPSRWHAARSEQTSEITVEVV
jgi:lipopolysaccharide transport system ATP-binding protein